MNRNFETLRQQRDELYQDARTHPDSEADQMVQILLLTALRNQQAGDYDANLGDVLAGERRGYRQARAKRIQERQGAGLGEAAESDPPGGEIGGEAGGREAGGQEASGAGGRRAGENQIEYTDAEMRLRKVAQALETAKAAAESGKEMDAMQIYNKIAEVIGLRPPS
jgi:hypothetical protein